MLSSGDIAAATGGFGNLQTQIVYQGQHGAGVGLKVGRSRIEFCLDN
jgi:hypothetical protein